MLFDQLKRRDFVTLLGGVAAANPPRSRRFSKPTRGWRHFKLCGCRRPSAVKPDADAAYTSGRPARSASLSARHAAGLPSSA
jgi:hypothetical protein